MLTSDQLKGIIDAVNLLNFYLKDDSSLSGQLRMVLNLIADPLILNHEEQLLIDQLIARVYPEIDSGPTTAPPEHVSTQWVIGYLDVAKSTFYKEVFMKLLVPVERIGGRPYYLKAEVLALMVRHEKGAWTYSKLVKERREKGGKM